MRYLTLKQRQASLFFEVEVGEIIKAFANTVRRIVYTRDLGLLSVFIAVLAILLAGCTTTNWAHPNKTEAQFNADKYDCHQTATQYAANLGFNGNPIIVREQYAKCMQDKYGYTPVKGTPEKG
jgi:hypothetical protein